MFQFRIPEPTEGPIKASNCVRCGKVFYKKEGSNNKYCSTDCKSSDELDLDELKQEQLRNAQQKKKEKKKNK